MITQGPAFIVGTKAFVNFDEALTEQISLKLHRQLADSHKGSGSNYWAETFAKIIVLNKDDIIRALMQEKPQ